MPFDESKNFESERRNIAWRLFLDIFSFGNDTDLRNVGDHLKKTRMDRQITQIEVTRIIGVSKDTVAYWEKGGIPRKKHHERIIAFLGYYPIDK